MIKIPCLGLGCGLLAATVGIARAEPPVGADPALHPWFQSLTDPRSGGSCCSEADCRHYQVDTSTDDDGTTHYRIKYRDDWLDVPPDSVLKVYDNPTGDYIACVYDYPTPHVLCFVIAPGT